MNLFKNIKTDVIKKYERGFSLIELVIVLAIMGILGAILLPSFSTIGQKAKEQSLKSSAQTIQIALETYFLGHGVYPTGPLDIGALTTTLETDNALTTAPRNPFTGQPCSASDTQGRVTYQTDAGATHYTLTIYGSNAQAAIETLTN